MTINEDIKTIDKLTDEGYLKLIDKRLIADAEVINNNDIEEAKKDVREFIDGGGYIDRSINQPDKFNTLFNFIAANRTAFDNLEYCYFFKWKKGNFLKNINDLYIFKNNHGDYFGSMEAGVGGNQEAFVNLRDRRGILLDRTID